ncbi:MAG: hypothetical protein KDC87_15985, partial [Planctomycetes bacterium]|nr:hypothetical protein [Planctomycetota bacterium]
YRRHLGNGGFGDERRVWLRLRTLDTGSSRYERFAKVEHRKLSRVALSRNVGRSGDPVDGATVTLTGPKGEKIEMNRLGDRLRWTDGKITLVRLGKDDGFQLRDGRSTGLSDDERQKLDREFLLNPWLWRGKDRAKALAESTLEGGVQALGRPAFRFRIPGPSEYEVYYFEDGEPAGYSYRDPLLRKLVDLRAVGEQAWIITDRSELSPGWKLAVGYDPLPDAKLFERPAQ